MRTITTSPEVSEIFTALSRARSNFKPIDKTEKADAGKYSYNFADLAMVYEATIPAMSAEGISHVQSFELDENGVFVRTLLTHCSGQWMSVPGAKIPQTKTLTDRDGESYTVDLSSQEMGIAETYARRYSFLAAVGVMPRKEDADGATDDKTTPGAAAKAIKGNRAWSGGGEQRAASGGQESAKDAQSGSYVEPESEAIRTNFHREAKAAGWGLSDIKGFLVKKFGEFRTNQLTNDQLKDALGYFTAHKPSEVTEENPIDDSDLPESAK